MPLEATKMLCGYLTSSAQTPQNGEMHSNNLLAKADKFFSVFDHFVGLLLKG